MSFAVPDQVRLAVADAVGKLPPHVVAFGEDRCVYCGETWEAILEAGTEKGCLVRQRQEREEKTRGDLP